MATLTLTQVFVNRVDTGEAVVGNSTPDRAREHTTAGDVRLYAGGRTRAYSSIGEQGKFEFTLAAVPLSTVEKLRTWVGITVQVRDARGQRFFGVFFGVPVVEHKNFAYYDVHIMLKTVSVVEGV